MKRFVTPFRGHTGLKPGVNEKKVSRQSLFSSILQKIVCVAIILSAALFAHSQTIPAKEATGVVSGKVTVKGKAAAGVVILIRPNTQSRTSQVSSYKGTTDLNGEYRIANVPAGNYIVTPFAPAFVNAEESGAQQTLFLNKGETVEHIDFALVRGGAITGKVTDAAGHPVVEQQVRIFMVINNQYDQNFSLRGVSTDDRGIYRIYGLKAGKYKVAAGESERGSLGNRAAVYRQTFYPAVSEADQAAIVEVSEGGETANIDITLGPSLTTYTATGRIVDGETGQPLAGVPYGIKQFVTPHSTSSMSNGAVSNSRGEFKLENLVPGKYAVEISPGPTNRLRADDSRFEIVDEDVSGLVVQTRKGATLSGVVVVEGADDKNARNDLRRVAVVAMSGLRNETGGSGSSTIGPDGSFTISGVAAGPTSLYLANSDRFHTTRIERNGVVQERFIDIKEGEDVSGVRLFVAYGNATIRGSVEVTNGTLPSGAKYFVAVRNVPVDPMVVSPWNFAQVDARGQFIVEGMFPGTYEISVNIWSADERTNFGEKKQQITVTAGSTNNVTLSIEINPKTTGP